MGRFFGDGFECVLVHQSFADELVLPDIDRVVGLFVSSDFFRCAVLFMIRIRDGVTIIAVGIDLQNRWAGFLMSWFRANMKWRIDIMGRLMTQWKACSHWQ